MPNRQQDLYYMKPYSPEVIKAEDWIFRRHGMFTLSELRNETGVGDRAALTALENAKHWDGYKLHEYRINGVDTIYELTVK